MILGFLEAVSNESTEYSKKILDMEKKSLLKESLIPNYPIISDEIIPYPFILRSVNELKNEINSVIESNMEDFYTTIYTSPLIGKVPTTIPILDVNEIQDIKPAYLKQFVDGIPKLLESVINGKLSKGAFVKYTTSKYISNLKKQIVVSNLSEYVKDSDLVNLDQRQVYTVDSNFISSTILPLIRTVSASFKDIQKESILIEKVIRNCVSDINTTITTYNNLKKKENLSNERIRMSDYALTALINTFLTTTKYVIACFIRKLSIYTYDLREFSRLRDTLMRYFPDGESIMHESVLDGKNDFRDEDIVHDLINGNSDFLLSVNERIEEYFYDMISSLEYSTGKKLYDDTFPFNKIPYNKISLMFSTIHKGLCVLKEELHDPDEPIEEIREKSGLAITYTNAFSSILSEIPDISYYTEYPNAKNEDVYSSIVNELKETNEEIVKYGKIAKGIYQEIVQIKNSIESNVNNEYENIERNKETLELLKEVNKNYRDFLLMFGRGLLDRYENLKTELTSREDLDELDPVEIDNTDYLSVTNECVLELLEISNEYVLESAYNELQRDVYYADMKTKSYFEADQNTQPTTNTSQSTTNNNVDNSNNTTQTNSTQQNGKDNNATKVTINDNSAESGGSGSGNGGGNKVDQGFMQKIIDKIKSFIASIKEKITKSAATNKSNAKWLTDNKDALLKRSYVNVSVNILPYQEALPISHIDKVIGVVNGLDKKKVIAMDGNKLENEIFNSIGLSSVQMENKDSQLSEKLTQCIKIANQKLQAVTFANSQLGQQIPKMIEYCENYYSNFEKDISSATDKINSTIEQFSKKMQEAGGEQDKSPEGSSLQGNITKISTCLTTLIGACTNAARDRANDYMTVLNSLVPKNKPAENTDQNNNSNNNQEQNNENQNQDQNANK